MGLIPVLPILIGPLLVIIKLEDSIVASIPEPGAVQPAPSAGRDREPRSALGALREGGGRRFRHGAEGYRNPDPPPGDHLPGKCLLRSLLRDLSHRRQSPRRAPIYSAARSALHQRPDRRTPHP